MADAPSTKIVIFSENEFKKYGYMPITHPDGYIYFEKGVDKFLHDASEKKPYNEASASKSPFREQMGKIKSSLTSIHDKTTYLSKRKISIPNSETVSSNDIELESKFLKDISQYSLANDISNSQPRFETKCTKRPTQIVAQKQALTINGEEKLNLHAALASKGFINCSFTSCNFISLSVPAMMRHRSNCSGVPRFDTNLCTQCGCWLLSSMQRDIHADKCSAIKFGAAHRPALSPAQVIANCKQVLVTLPTRRDIVPHQKPHHTESKEIVQPSPQIPAGTYLRRRAYASVHFEIWSKKFKEMKYIPCHFQDCLFIALSVEDMCQHYGYCNGDSSFANFACPYCSGHVTSQAFLNTHIAMSHPSHTRPSSMIRSRKPVNVKYQNIREDEVIGREEEFPMKVEVDDIAESLIENCDDLIQVQHPKTFDIEDGPFSSQPASNDHDYTLLPPVVESLIPAMMAKTLSPTELSSSLPTTKYTQENVEIETYEIALPVVHEVIKPKIATKSHVSRSPLISPRSVAKQIIGTCTSEIVKNVSNKLISEINTKKLLSFTGQQKVSPTDDKSLLAEKATVISSTIESPWSRRSVITNGRLVNSRSTSSEELSTANTSEHAALDYSQQCYIAEPPTCVGVINIKIKHHEKTGVPKKDTSVKKTQSNIIVTDTGSNVGPGAAEGTPLQNEESRKEATDGSDFLACKNNSHRESIFPTNHPMKRKRGRPKRLKPLDEEIKLGKREKEKEEAEKLIINCSRKRTSARRFSFNEDSEVENIVLKDDKAVFPIKRKSRGRAKRLHISDESDTEIDDDDDDENETNWTPNRNDDSDLEGKKSSKSKKRKAVEENGCDPAASKRNRNSSKRKRDNREEAASGVIEKKQPARGRPSHSAVMKLKAEKGSKCGKCGAIMVKNQDWEKHNAIKHLSLGWVEGDTPLDQRSMDSSELLVRLRFAFKFCKYGECELCGITKKSFMGLHAHMLVCGKSSEELEQVMAKCEICGKYLQAYSMPTHVKTHQKDERDEITLPQKRRSALKAISSLKSFVEERKSWILYHKSNSLPDINFTFIQTSKNEIACCRKNCSEICSTSDTALKHFFQCSLVPDMYFQCLECPNFYLSEKEIEAHCGSYHGDRVEKERAENEYNVPTDDEDYNEEENIRPIRIRAPQAKTKLHIGELKLKKEFEARGKISSCPYKILNSKAFDEEIARQSRGNKVEKYDQLYTCPQDWVRINQHELEAYLPPLRCSLSVRHGKGDRVELFQKLHLFDSQCSEDFNIGFVGGSVQNLAWCPVSLNRVKVARQYLAISVATMVDTTPGIRSSTTTKSLLQIWDCGAISENGNELNRLHMELGIAMDVGELWDLTWSPNDAWLDGNDGRLPRIGLIATACNDGAVRIYSISSLNKKRSETGISIYQVPAVALLKRGLWRGSEDDPCLRVTWADETVICAGYRSGRVAVWRLQQLACGHVCRQGKTLVLPCVSSFQAHHLPITAIALCPGNGRSLATASSDKKMKVWDLKNPLVALRCESGPPIQKLQWARNWPALFFLLQENIVDYYLPPHFSFHRSHYLQLKSTINDFSISDWAFVTGVAGMTGDLSLRKNDDVLGINQKNEKLNMVVSKICMSNLTSPGQAKDCASYKELERNNVGITFNDYSLAESIKHANKTAEKVSGAKFTANAIKKLAFNPNYRVFHYVALGLQCGFIRVMKLTCLQDDVNKAISSSELIN